MTKTTRQQPRGIRNNNPLNIRIGNVWLGEVQENTDGVFEQFVNMTYGLRAAFVLLRRYIRHYHFNTISTIISRWAPSLENNTIKYIDYVSDNAKINPDDTLYFEDIETMCNIVQAMAKFETGVTIPGDTIRKAYDLT